MTLLDLSPARLKQVATGIALLALVLVVLNAILVLNNVSRQAEVNQRQQFINQSIQLSRISQNLVSALAQSAVRNDDKEIRDMLASSGFTIQQANPPAPQTNTVPAEPAAPSKPTGK